IETARATGCDAVYPGYGFLSEKAEFARLCEQAGLTFVGPASTVIACMGDKVAARRTARELGIPIVPGSTDGFADAEAAERESERIGYPLLLKAAGGGGGRGMRVVERPDDFQERFASATAEAKAAFGDPTIYLERYLMRVRHIEVQIFADQYRGTIHLWER